jgi:hypothetical protein
MIRHFIMLRQFLLIYSNKWEASPISFGEDLKIKSIRCYTPSTRAMATILLLCKLFISLLVFHCLTTRGEVTRKASR